jgi:hypothetical protein
VKSLEELEKIVSAATPGPWYFEACNVTDCWCGTVGSKKGVDDNEHCIIPSGSTRTPDCIFIATANPKLVGLLLAEVVANRAFDDNDNKANLTDLLGAIDKAREALDRELSRE